MLIIHNYFAKLPNDLNILNDACEGLERLRRLQFASWQESKQP